MYTNNKVALLSKFDKLIVKVLHLFDTFLKLVKQIFQAVLKKLLNL